MKTNESRPRNFGKKLAIYITPVSNRKNTGIFTYREEFGVRTFAFFTNYITFMIEKLRVYLFTKDYRIS
jgi:hypothetical protein